LVTKNEEEERRPGHEKQISAAATLRVQAKGEAIVH